jgi:c-di-GMP-binding flagellar brake protein YcgR
VFFVSGIAFLAVLSMTLLMLWAHERAVNKKTVLRAQVEESWHGEDRRKHRRFKNNFDVEYSVEKKNHFKNGQSADISEGGLGLLLDEKLSQGLILHLKLAVPGAKKMIEAEGEVIWTNDVDDKGSSGRRFFRAGIKFVAIKEPYSGYLSEYLRSLESDGVEK